MLQRVLNLLCKVGWHYGTWGYDSGPEGTVKCGQTRICRGCLEPGFRVRHDMHWRSDGWFKSTESGVCMRCEQSETLISLLLVQEVQCNQALVTETGVSEIIGAHSSKRDYESRDPDSLAPSRQLGGPPCC